MTITGVVVRRRVTDLEAAVTFYEALTGARANRFSFGGADLAAVGPFLVFAAPDDAAQVFERVVATISVDDLDELATRLEALGATIIAPPAPTPNGQRMIARHPDGGVFEYVGA
jgi:predicted enzyme related to lactoylglutathione lyase